MLFPMRQVLLGLGAVSALLSSWAFYLSYFPVPRIMLLVDKQNEFPTMGFFEQVGMMSLISVMYLAMAILMIMVATMIFGGIGHFIEEGLEKVHKIIDGKEKKSSKREDHP